MAVNNKWLPGLLVCLSLLGLSACGQGTGGPSGDQSEPSAPASSLRPGPVPDDGVQLSDSGIRNGPAGFSVPKGLVVQQVIDQENVVTLLMDDAQGQLLADYLVEHLDQMGFNVTGRDPASGTPASLVFVAPGWEGAFTTGGATAGLTLRRNPGGFSTPR